MSWLLLSLNSLIKYIAVRAGSFNSPHPLKKIGATDQNLYRCDLSPERASQRATGLDFSRYSDKWEDVVNDEAVELISICTSK